MTPTLRRGNSITYIEEDDWEFGSLLFNIEYNTIIALITTL